MNGTCANCDTPMQGEFCHACGQRRAQPIDLPLLAEALSRETVDLEGRYVRTLIELTVRPGRAIAGYLEGHRVGLYNPGKYLFLNTTVAILLFSLLGIDLLPPDAAAALDDEQRQAVDITLALAAYLNFVMALLTAVVQSLLSRWGAHRRNLAESFVVQMFVQGHLTIPAVLFTLLVPGLASLASFLAMVAMIPYLAWILRSVHGLGTWAAIGQSLLVFIANLVIAVAVSQSFLLIVLDQVIESGVGRG